MHSPQCRRTRPAHVVKSMCSAADSDEVGMLYAVRDVEVYMCGVHDIAADAGHRNRHITCCQSIVSNSLCELLCSPPSLSKPVMWAPTILH